MRFNGKSGVEVRLPNDLEDLKGYTSISLFLQRPNTAENRGTSNMFVMYLGNKDVSISFTFPLLLKQNLVFKMHDTLCHWRSRKKSHQHINKVPQWWPVRGLSPTADGYLREDVEAPPSGLSKWASCVYT